MSITPPTAIVLHQQSRVLEVQFDDGQRYRLPCEYLRVFSPSAEVRGHGGPIATIPGKREVNIIAVDPVGHYAVKLVFDDGHDTGIFTWETLRSLGHEQEANWKDYLHRMDFSGLSRDPPKK